MSSVRPWACHECRAKPATGQAHPIAPQGNAQAQPVLSDQQDPVEEAEGKRHQLGPPRVVAVSHGIETLEPILPIG